MIYFLAFTHYGCRNVSYFGGIHNGPSINYVVSVEGGGSKIVDFTKWKDNKEGGESRSEIVDF